MKIATGLAAVLTVVLLSGCSTAGPTTSTDGSPSPSVRPGTSPSEGSTPMATTPPPAAPTPPPEPLPRTGEPGAPPPPASRGADPEQPRDLVGAPMTVTGTVTIVDGCTILDAGSRRWALLGEPVKRLRQGNRVTVRGRAEAAPAGCQADAALQVILVS